MIQGLLATSATRLRQHLAFSTITLLDYSSLRDKRGHKYLTDSLVVHVLQ